MEKLIEKLDSYNILNNLLPGIVLEYLFENMLNVKLVDGSIVENLFVFYFLGMVVSRIGSVVVEPLCKKIKWVKYASYGEYLKASKKDVKIDLLSEINNTYRTILTVCLILLLAKGFLFIVSKIGISRYCMQFIVIIGLIMLFAVAYKKQTNYVANRVKKVNEREE